MPRQSADAQHAVLQDDAAQVGDRGDVDQQVRGIETQVEHRQQALAAGEEAGFTLTGGMGCEGGLDRCDALVIEGAGLHRIGAPVGSMVLA